MPSVRDETDESTARERRRGGARRPDSPTDMPRQSWPGILKRTFHEFREDNITDWAAALTYYSILSIFPALLALVAVLGVIGDSVTQPLIDNVTTVAPGAAQEIFTDAVTNLENSKGAAGFVLIAALAGAIWSASGYVAAFMRASNAIYEVEEGRPIWKTLGTRVLTTIAMLLMFVVVGIAVAVTGPVAEEIGDVIGLGSAAVTAWEFAKWPFLAFFVMTMLGVLYWASPNVKHPGFRWVTPGGITAVVLWIIASAGFAFYVSNFSAYDATYGALGGVIVFLVWLWITNIAFLFGAELNAEVERGREIEAGKPAEEEPFLEPRDEPDDDEDEAKK